MGLILKATLREASRQRLPVFLAVLAGVVVLGARGLRDFNFGSSELKFLADLGLGATGFFSAVLAIVAPVQFFLGEIEHRTLQPMLVRPLTRPEFIVGRYAGVVTLLGVFCGLMTILLAAVIWQRSGAFGLRPGAVDYCWLAASGVALWEKAAVLAACTLSVATYARGQAFAIATGFLLWMGFHLHPLARHAAEHASTGAGRLAAAVLARVLPDFGRFDLGETTATWAAAGGLGLYALGYVVMACALAVAFFERREL